ncbi:TPA: anthranilate phosphoribosyltransferase [Haemophilus influenzae]|uniref:anthranilate phosphoribosyltransferase n=1 Tax=Haemophilus influenzae TaxID=727 RepID=UPI000392C3E9|nr:anthranilate phosphoribosyltransferase [Haemophilus influenzae]AGV11948.1 anthranilate phosphoribosyltransferase [Haemophilus influenzae KR494]MCK8820653.1 anthranilate phosphoribosyltransferase [Haemophilus influenzae]MCK8880183.1 anthranilate phosphoribosyltransferase [Haemophilus influenzae]MDF3118908.1 anthranilate phosphoribosyltransferase [Haemophilus influenzae]OXS17409.1 anthranilate phosphoribosyltransferase [Haemophilus influenzae]
MQHEQLLEQLYNGQILNKAESAVIFNAIMQGELNNEQIAAMLIALKVRGVSIDELSGAVSASLQNAKAFPYPDYPFADIVGTGGDGQNTINISTASAIVAASMGAKVAKHGNRSVSSKSGASDVLTALGVNVNVTPEQAQQALDEIGVCFLFAQQYHSGFRHVAPVRASLKTCTIFNILGPLINPARPTYHLLGVYVPELVKTYAETAVALGHQHSFVVHGSGLDEVALHGETQVAEIKNGKIEYFTLTPEDFGLKTQSLESLRGGEPQENAQMLTALLQGKGKAEHANAVAANTALLLKLFGHDDLKQNVQSVLVHLASGKAFETLQNLTKY